MNKYLEAIEEIEEIENIVIQDTKLKRCCTASWELLKAILEYLKNLRKVKEWYSGRWKPKNKGFHIDKKGFHCIHCRCKRQLYHKETKTVKENDKVTTNTVVDKITLKFGGRNVSPDEIFLTDEADQTSLAICDTGWGQSQVTPEELEDKIAKPESEVERIDIDVTILKNIFNILD